MKRSAKPNPTTAQTIALEHITPELARAYLDRNPVNRKPVAVVVERYKRDMISNHWRLSGDAIRFNTKGDLIDGQHRLMACIEAGVPFDSYVIRGLDEDVINVIDSGRSRRAGDILTIRGYTQAALLASTSRWLLTIKHGLKSKNANAIILRPSHDEIISFVERNPLLLESMRFVTSGNPPLGITASMLAAIHYVASHHLVEPKPERADAFVNVFTTGAPDYAGDPAHKLRELFTREKLRRVYPTQDMMYTGSVYAWNNFADKRPIQVFRVPPEARIRGLVTDAL